MVTYTEIVHGSIRDVLDVVFRHKGKITSFFVVVTVGVTTFTYFAPPVYRSEAQLLVRFGRENLSVDLSNQERAATMLQDKNTQESQVNSEVTILTSRYLMEKVVNEFGDETILDDSYSGGGSKRHGIVTGLGSVKRFAKGCLVFVGFSTRMTPHEEAIKRVSESVSVEAPKNSNVVNVCFEATDRQFAKDALDRLIQFYLERHIEVNAAKASPEFFEAESARASKVLVEAEGVLDAFRSQYGIAAMSNQQEVLLLQLKDLEYETENAAAQERASRARIAALEKALEGRSDAIELSRTTGVHNFGVDAMKERLLDLRIKETDLAARYKDDYLPLVEVREQIRKTEEILGQQEDTHTQVTTGIDINHQTLMLNLETERSQLGAHEERRKSLADEVARLQDKLAALSSREVELKSLERSVQLAEEEYRQYRGNLHRARISVALDRDKVSNVSAVQDATLPLTPVRPRKPLIIMMGIVFGLLGGIGLAYVCNYFDDTFKTDADVRKWLDLPVLASISEREFRACT